MLKVSIETDQETASVEQKLINYEDGITSKEILEVVSQCMLGLTFSYETIIKGMEAVISNLKENYV